jgi:hypothetical protein
MRWAVWLEFALLPPFMGAWGGGGVGSVFWISKWGSMKGFCCLQVIQLCYVHSDANRSVATYVLQLLLVSSSLHFLYLLLFFCPNVFSNCSPSSHLFINLTLEDRCLSYGARACEGLPRNEILTIETYSSSPRIWHDVMQLARNFIQGVVNQHPPVHCLG